MKINSRKLLIKFLKNKNLRHGKERRKIMDTEIKTTQNDKDPQLLKFHFGDWHNGYFIAVCQKQV